MKTEMKNSEMLYGDGIEWHGVGIGTGGRYENDEPKDPEEMDSNGR